MNVAQYWADEANDAVHYDIAFSVLSTPELPILAEEDSEEEDEGKNAVNLPELPTNWEILDTLDLNIDANINIRWWDDNGEAIPAFAAFCKEDSHQEMDRLEAYSPYAVFRRKGLEIETEIVGKMLRPWADGMRPEEWDEE